MKKKEELISVAIFVDRKKDEMIFIEFSLNIELVQCIFCLHSLCVQQFIYISYKLNVKRNCMFERGQSFNVYIGHQAYDAKPNQTLPICFSSLHQEVNQTEQRIIKLTLSVNSLQFMLFYTCLSFFNYNISFGFFL